MREPRNWPKPPSAFESLQRADDDQEEIKRMFTPEFRNRLDSIIPFAALGQKTILRVVDKFVIQLEAQLSDRRVVISLI